VDATPECWVLVEAPRGRILRQSLEALGAARALLPPAPPSLTVVWAGEPADRAQREQLRALGVARLHGLPGPGAAPSSRWEDVCLAGLRTLYRNRRPAWLVAGDTPFSRALAPRLAVLEGAGYVPRVSYVRRVGNGLQLTRPLVQGRLAEIVRLAGDCPGVVCVASGAFPLPRPAARAGAEPPSWEPAPAPDPAPVPACGELLHRSETPAHALDIEDAGVVVAGGKGMGSRENFALLEELAVLLGGCVAASRIAVDLGWAGRDRLVGQTGRKISPELYVACGISGAPQHRAGLRDPRYLLAINTDPEAPIFRTATWAVVGDALELLPAWIRQLKGAGA